MDVPLRRLDPTLVGEIEINVFGADFFQPGEDFVTMSIAYLGAANIWTRQDRDRTTPLHACIGGAIASQ